MNEEESKKLTMSDIKDFEKITNQVSYSKKRYETCKTCENFNLKYKFCSECHCFMPIKVLISKTACPINKW